ncbi:hypothetical protein AAFF_G00365720 [Aldrovandia affinis]|uniref:Reverse transcriptase domain-containing protein n=1 Tax=Aldrovandia affinis TaxID=143900 RepID=A0AAD7SH84_9TELE|nr:hypothetical protein AAFF_G00365720 [Aldrovandia affinis]
MVLNDLRPVALISLVMKAFERIVKSHIIKATTAQLDPLQFAYRADHGPALNEFMEWCDASCLELNVTKTKEMVVVFSSRQQESSLKHTTAIVIHDDEGDDEGISDLPEGSLLPTITGGFLALLSCRAN